MSRPRKPTSSARKAPRAKPASRTKTTDVLLRGVDRDLIDVFKARAERHGRSLQSELQLSLRREARRNFDEALKLTDAWHARLANRRFPPTKALIDEDRRR